MSRPRNRQQTSISLFPFLAVLVCAMGALIFLLVVTTRRVRLQAIVRAQEAAMHRVAAVDPKTTAEDRTSAVQLVTKPLEASDPALEAETSPISVQDDSQPRDQRSQSSQEDARPPLPVETDTLAESESERLRTEWEAIVAQLASEREAWQQRLKEQKAQDAIKQAELGRLQAELAERRRALAAGERRTADDEHLARSLSTKIQQVEGRIDALERQLATARRHLQAARSKYAIIPFDGESGTTRRPILIECKDDALTFLPEQVRVTRSDLNGFTVKYNPLRAGALALAAFWTAWSRVHQDASEPEREPYVLLIVRPSGAFLFYAARAILSQSKVPFGYELVEDDWELALPSAEPEAVKVCRQAVDAVLAERKRLIRFLTSHGDDSDTQLQLDDPPEGGGIGSRVSLARSQPRHFERPPGSRQEPEGNKDNTTWHSADSLRGGTSRQRMPVPNTPAGNDSRESDEPGASRTSLDSSIPRQGDRGNAESVTRLGSQHQDSHIEEATVDESVGSRILERFGQFATADVGGRSATAAGQVSPLNLRSHHTAKTLEMTPEQLSQQKWGLVRPGATIGMERSVPIDLYFDRIVVGHHYQVDVSDVPTQTALFHRARQAIQMAVSDWDEPPESFYWIPTIEFRVHPGGLVNDQRLNDLLGRAGLRRTDRFLLDESSDTNIAEGVDDTTRS